MFTEQCLNTKEILVASSAPDNPYDGQLWSDTSENPPVLKTYDATNTVWMERRPVWYETVTISAGETNRDPRLDDTHTNGTLVVQYDGVKDVLWARSNSEWFGAKSS